MKSVLCALLVVLIELAVPRLASAGSPRSESVAVGSDGVQQIWNVERAGKDIYFHLRPQDLERDFVVFRTSSNARDDWQLLRWVSRNDKIVLLTLSGRREELLDDWAAAADAVAEFPSSGQVDGRYRLRVTSLFGHVFPYKEESSAGGESIGTREFGEPKVFPKNVVVSLTLDVRNQSSTSRWVRWNFVKLPERKMAVRLVPEASAFNPRGGWLAEHNFPHRLLPNEVVMRWRMEGRRSREALEEPDAPITIYVDPTTPERWRRWVAAGIESWQPAFEAIGHPRAIRSAVPTDVDLIDYDDVRVSVACWKSKERGCDGFVFDPRTGEILQHHISGQEAALKGYLARYIVSMAAIDGRVLESPLPESLLGGIVQRVATHEIGHTLGLRDGNYGVFTYSTAQIRDKNWVSANGFTPSIMNYARFNFVAQPEDGMPVELLQNRLGPADMFWIRWGYGHDRQDAISQLWDSSPAHRYRMDDGMFDIYKLSETPGVSDPVESVRLGMRNLEKSMALLERHKFHETDPQISDLIDARSLYDAALAQWLYMHRQLLSLVGGRYMDVSERNSLATQEPTTGVNRIPGGYAVDREKQKEAVMFLCNSFFSRTPEFLVDGAIVRAAGLDRQAAQALVKRRREQLFEELTSRRRLNQMIEQGSLEDSYGVSHLMRDMKSCVVR